MGLKENEECLLTMLQNLPLVTVMIDCEGKVLFCSDFLSKLIGWPKDEVIGKHWLDVTAPADSDGKERFNDHMRQGDLPAHEESAITTRSGEQRLISWTTIVFRDDASAPIGIASIGQDITDRRRAEEASWKAAQDWQSTFGSVKDAVWLLDADMRVTRANRATEAIFGLKPEQIAGRHCWEVVHGTTEPIPTCPVVLAAKSLQRETTQLRMGKRWIEVTADPVVDETKRHSGTVHLVSDITEQVAMEERLRQSEKMSAVGQLAGGIAHEFNNQLAGVLGFAQMLEGKLDDPKLRRYVRNICTAGERMADLTQQLLSFARKGNITTPSVDFHKLIADVIGILKHGLGKPLDERVRIHQRLEAATFVTTGEPLQLRSLLLSLATNARDAMPCGGEMTFATSVETLTEDFCGQAPFAPAPGLYLRIAVSDTGCGMDEEMRKHLFEPFYTTKDIGKGTGLGLPAVYGGVERHKGTLTVQSEKGKGSTFAIYLPLARSPGEADEADEADEAPTAAATTPEGKGKILVVDDEDVARSIAVDMLNNAGYQTLTARNGNEAVETYRRSWQTIDVVVLDLTMPGLNGDDAFAALRAINPLAKVILASGYDLNQATGGRLLEGVLGFVQKPYRQGVLERKVAEALKRG